MTIMDTDSMRAMRLIGEELVHVIGEQFAGYGGQIIPDAANPKPVPDAIRAVSAIGFTGEGFRGALTFVATATTIELVQREFFTESNPDAWRSTASEYANMLLGRLKNRLVGKGLFIQMTTPTTSVGTDVHVHEHEGRPTRWVACHGGGIEVAVRFQAEFDDDFVMPDDAVAGRALAEGSLLFL